MKSYHDLSSDDNSIETWKDVLNAAHAGFDDSVGVQVGDTRPNGFVQHMCEPMDKGCHVLMGAHAFYLAALCGLMLCYEKWFESHAAEVDVHFIKQIRGARVDKLDVKKGSYWSTKQPNNEVLATGPGVNGRQPPVEIDGPTGITGYLMR